MTVQEAISELESLPESTKSEAVLMAIQALKKQIPTRVIRKRWEISKCPCCNTELGEWLEDGYHHVCATFACVAVLDAPADNLPYAESRPHGTFVRHLWQGIICTTNA